MVAELQPVFLFCGLYSAVVVGSLLTFMRVPNRIP